MAEDARGPIWAMAIYDFFISFTRADKAWANWIFATLEGEGYKCIMESWDFVPGHNFVLRMQEAATESTRTLCVLSPAFLRSSWGMLELVSAMARDPTGTTRPLLPVRVAEMSLPGLLPGLIYIDLVGQDEPAATCALREGVAACVGGRREPPGKPRFPGTHAADPLPTLGPVAPSRGVVAERYLRLYKTGREILERHRERDLASAEGRAWLAELGAALTGAPLLREHERSLAAVAAVGRPGGPLIHFVDWGEIQALVDSLAKLCEPHSSNLKEG